MGNKISDRHQETINYALNVIKSSTLSQHISDIILFGSVARGTAKYSSDVDLLLVLNKDAEELVDNRDIRTLKGDVSPLSVSLPEVDLKVTFGMGWRQSKSTIDFNIRKDGYSIWESKDGTAISI